MKNKRNRMLLLAAGFCLISFACMCFALRLPERETAVFTPPPFEESARTGTPEVPESMGWSMLDAKAYRVGVCGAVCVEDGRADLWFTNPAENTVWMKLRILDDQNHILAETGLLRPGEYVRSVEFLRLPAIGETIRLKIMAYEPETYYSAGSVVLNTTAAEGGTK